MCADIDATVVLGLAAKMNQVFAEPGSYLSFPLAPVPLSVEGLRALSEDPMSAPGQQALCEFSLLVNEVPAGPLWQPDGDRLWEVYGDVLAAVELAQVKRTDAEESAYQKAYDLLYDVKASGKVATSALVLTYEQYRDAYLSAAQEYNNRKGEADLSADPKVRKQWTADQAALHEKVAQAEQDWSVAGKRAEVEEARRLLREIGSRSPLTAWAGYRKLFDPDLPELFFRTSADSSMYVPTSYLPTNVVDGTWPTIAVGRDELASLAAGAPQDLRSRLASGAGDAALSSVSFEYSSVAILRPWFAPEVFASRAWRFHDAARVLSDGKTPPTGECGAFVSGLALARKITIQRVPQLRKIPSLAFLPMAAAAAEAPIVRPYTVAMAGARAEMRRKVMVKAVPERTSPVDMRAIDMRVAPIARPGFTGVALRREAMAGRIMQPIQPALAPTPVTIRSVPRLRLPIQAKPAPPPAPGAETTATDTSNVYVLAFICRMLPKSPNPDPALQW
jgi:hypothetical protein